MGTAGSNDRKRDDPRARLRENATGIASMLVTGFWLAAMFTGQSWWLAALLVGYIVVVPLVALVYGDEEDRKEWVDGWTSDSSTDAESKTDSETSIGAAADSENAREALETLRERYAAGELTDEQFERKLERLIETETIEDVQDRARNRDGERGADRDRNSDRNRDYEYER
ncbi:SHOCT domain-containing protein [Halosolutus gelatinilyticus]|uniref:SHOCT domain-containing protein n=1 Tax=Halosolutus gelatinilyticus TaxID=2931975 RepID=UPI001FF5ABD8|nr:SHOCT domain-containing protein [Halosolutus gelatinilyticus]